jgi:hypothetical protein
LDNRQRHTAIAIVEDDAIRPLLALSDHDLHQPTEALLQPAKEALHEHFKKIFRGEYIPCLLWCLLIHKLSHDNIVPQR